MSESSKAKWLANNAKVCLCLGISRKKFLDEITKGCCNIDSLNRRLGSGRGACRGKRCQPKIRALLRESFQ